MDKIIRRAAAEYEDSVPFVARNEIALARNRASNSIVGGIQHNHTISVVAHRDCAGNVGADEVALNNVISRIDAKDDDAAPPVARYDVARGGSSSNDVVGGILNGDAAQVVA